MKGLYHATVCTFRDGQILENPKATSFYVNAVREIEAARPSGLPSRVACFFAADSAAAAANYMRGQRVGSFNIYEVEMDVFHKAPFCLIDRIEKGVLSKIDIDHLVDEYWRSSNNWGFYEYFGPEMRIVREVAAPGTPEITSAHITYLTDAMKLDGFSR